MNQPCFGVVECWFDQGLYHILEQIFLQMPTKTIQACKQVSAKWGEIVESFFNSELPRLVKWQNKRIDQAWTSKDFSLKLEMDLQDFSVRDMIADDRHLIIVGLNQELEPEIKIFDSQSLQFVRNININDRMAASKIVYRIKYSKDVQCPIKAAMTEKYMVINFGEIFEQEENNFFNDGLE